MRELPSRAETAAARAISCALSAALLGPAVEADDAPSRVAPGDTVPWRSEGAGTAAFVMPVQAGAFVRVVAHQEGVDVLLRVEGPGGATVESDVVEAPQGRESVSAVMASDGELRIEVRGKARDGEWGAVTLVTEGLRTATAADLERIEAEAALRNAERLRREGKATSYREALGEFEKARRLATGISDPFTVAVASLGEGTTRTNLGDYAAAIALLEGSVAGWRSLQLRALEARALNGLGTARYYAGELERALETYLAALPPSRASGDRSGEVRILVSIGAAYGTLGLLTKSLEHTELALAMKRAMGDRKGEANILHNLAFTYHLQGEMQKALDLLREALPLAALGDPHEKPAILTSLAAAYHTLGDRDEALVHYNRALEAWREIGHRSGEAKTHENLGVDSFDHGEIEAALEHWKEALALRRALGDGSRQTLVKLAEAERRLGHPARAEELAAEGLREAENAGHPTVQGEAHWVLGQIRMDEGDLAAALEHQKRALSIARGIGERDGEVKALQGLARIRVKQGDLQAARENLEQALALLGAIRADLRGLDLRASFAGQTGSVHEDHVDVLLRLHDREPGGGWLVRAFEASERGRARTLAETLAASRVGAPEGVASEPEARARSLQHQLAARLDRHLRVLTRPHTEAEAQAERAAVEGLRSELRAAQAEASAAVPRLAALEQPAVLSLRELQEGVLDPDTVVLEYALGEERSVLFVVGARSISAYAVPARAAMEASVKAALEALTRPPQGEGPWQGRAALERLSADLLGPARAAIEGKRLVIVPDGALQGLPFAALPSPSRPGEALIERHQVVAVPSASLVALLRSEAHQRPPPTRSVVVFADPVFAKDDERLGSKGAGSPLPRNLTRAIEEAGMGAGGLGRLPFTRREASAIVDLARDGQAMLDFEASRQNVTTADLARYRFVHFATHGFLNSAHPDLSGLVLSLFDRRGDPRDGFLSAADVLNLELSADLVVLSGCRTALGREIRGEGVVGLTRALMYAGTSRVLASFWKVDDAATAELMGQLYRGILSERLSPAEALQKAQQTMARHKRWRHPYYWAGFQLQGDWN